MRIPLHFLREDEEQLKTFFGQYTLRQMIGCPPVKQPVRIPKMDRVCRFCGLKGKDTSWKSDAHAIPQLLGNKYLISEDECHHCNQLFSDYESHLASFLGISRVLNSVHAAKVPQFKSSAVTAGPDVMYNGHKGISIKRSTMDSDAFQFDRASNTFTLSVTKPSYIPLKAYKALVKIGLSLLPLSEMINYRVTTELIMTSRRDPANANACIVAEYQIPLNYGYQSPIVLLFEKQQREPTLPTHIVMLFYRNTVYQTYLPLNTQDTAFFNGQELTMPVCPPVFLGQIPENLKVTHNVHNMTSAALKKGELQLFTLHTETPFDNLKCINSVTGEEIFKPFDPSEIVAIDMM